MMPPSEDPEVMERMTDHAHKVMKLANVEVQRLGHGYIGSEHILLGLIRTGTGVAIHVLRNLGINPHQVRLEVERLVPAAPSFFTMDQLPATPEAKTIIELAIDEARSLNHDYVAPARPPGLLRAKKGVAEQALMNLGLKLEVVREEVISLLGGRNSFTNSGANVVDLPIEVMKAGAELDASIAWLIVAKEEAIVNQDFEKAADVRDQVVKLQQKKPAILRELGGEPSHGQNRGNWQTEVLSPRSPRRLTRATAGRISPFWHMPSGRWLRGCRIPNHCRESGDHGTHCWVVDLLLGQL